MLSKNFIKKASVSKEYSELDIARMDYVEEQPEYYEDDGLIAQGVELTDIFESEKVSKKGEPYISRFARLSFFDDGEEIKVSFPITFWNPVKEGVAKIKADNPLSSLIKFIAEDNVNNTFDVDYKELQKLIDEIESVKIVPRVIKERNGFQTWGFTVVELNFKG